MFTSAFLGIFAAISALSLGISIVSLVIHWKRPDIDPETARLTREIGELRTAYMDVLEQVDKWIKRDRVRAAREKRETTPVDEPEAKEPADKKQAIRARLRTLNGGK